MAISSPVSAFQTRMVASLPAEATRRPSGLKTTLFTWSVCLTKGTSSRQVDVSKIVTALFNPA
jgi:hypothetical protein